MKKVRVSTKEKSTSFTTNFLTIFYIFIYLFLFDLVINIQKCNVRNTNHNAVLIASCYWFDKLMEKHDTRETGLIVFSLFVERDKYYIIFS